MDETLKKEFPAAAFKSGSKRMVYLDSACTALKLRAAADAQRDFLLDFGVCPGNRAVSRLSSEAEERVSRAREVIADFVGADPEEIIFSFSATDAANLLINSYKFSPAKNEVLVSGLEHNCVLLPLYNLARRGKIKLGIIPLKGFKPDLDAFKKMLNRRTALVFVTRASNIFGGAVEDIKKFAAAAKKVRADFASDESQFLPTHREDLARLGADFAFFSGHKLGAPFGTGILYVKKSAYKKLENYKAGGGTISAIGINKNALRVAYLGNHQGFEPGIQNYSGLLGLSRAIEFWKDYGFEKLRGQVSGLVKYAVKRLKRLEPVNITGEGLENGGVVSFTLKNAKFQHQDFSIFLNENYRDKFIAVRAGRHCADLACLFSGIDYTVRLSFHAYNTARDVDDFVSALEDYLGSLE